MTFLPMVQRELRVLARKPATYRWRWIIGGFAFGMALFLIMIMGLAGNPRGWGEALFIALSVYAGIVCVLAGVFGTTDIISEERREGTIGLLFLTDLKGYDVVIGKFSAVALNAFYWLLAIIPVLAMPLLIGGVTFGEVFRVSLGLGNLLFFTMSTGTWASSRSVEVQGSLFRAAGVMVIFGLLTPFLYMAPAVISSWGTALGFSTTLGPGYERLAAATFSPIIALLHCGDATYKAGPGSYWWSLVASNFLGWLLLLLAAWRLPKIWHKPVKETGGWVPGQPLWSRKTTTFEDRATMLDENPLLLLMRPPKDTHVGIVVLVVIAFALVLAYHVWFDHIPEFLHRPFYGGAIRWFVLLPLEIMLTFQACRFFSYARRSGLFELLASTPLTVKQMVSAHWATLHRTFRLPFLLAFLLMIYGGGLHVIAGIGGFRGSVFMELLPFFALLMGIGLKVMDYFLLGWMGAWMSLKLKRPGWAALFTILFALVIPSFLCWIGYLLKPMLIAISRHYVVYELPRLVRLQFDGGMAPRATPPPLR